MIKLGFATKLKAKVKVFEYRLTAKLFSASWYKKKYPDVLASRMDPLDHYIRFGQFEDRDPHPLFSASYYYVRHPQAKDANINPLAHFVAYGDSLNYRPHPLFDPRHVKRQLTTKGNSLSCYLAESLQGRRISPHPVFDADFYLSQFSDHDTIEDLLTHYLQVGANRGWEACRFFDSINYLTRYPDVANAGINPLVHYFAGGARENRDPHPIFDSSWYRAVYMENQPQDMTVLEHFLAFGLTKSYPPHPMFPARQLTAQSGRDGNLVTNLLATGKLIFSPPKLDDEPTAVISRELESLASSKVIEAFVVFNTDAISGGIFSIFSVVEELRKLGSITSLFSMPGSKPILRYARFNNSEIISPYESFISLLKMGKIKRVHLPEVLLIEFANMLKSEGHSCENLDLNILNQNADLMPDKARFEEICRQFRSVTMTTAHALYSSQEHTDRWGVPLKHISTYVSHDSYTRIPFSQKKNFILLSPDRMAGDSEFLDYLSNSTKGYILYRIQSVHYEMFKFCLSYLKFCITFGEGLDNYFIETVFTGGVPFSVYNPVFMPAEMKELPNVFADLQEMSEKIFVVMRRVEVDEIYRKNLIDRNYKFLSKIYDGAIYRKKLQDFMGEKFDFYPETKK